MNKDYKSAIKINELDRQWNNLSERISRVIDQLCVEADFENTYLLEERKTRLITKRDEIEREIETFKRQEPLLKNKFNSLQIIEDKIIDLDKELIPLLYEHSDSEGDKLKPIDGFVGRKSQLLQLDKWYQSNIPVASIIGLTGIGKSYLTRQWCALRNSQYGFKPIYIDASLGFLPPHALENEFTQSVFHSIALKLNIQINDEIENSVLALASRTRQSNSLLVIDHFEKVLQKKRSNDDVPPGIPTKTIQQFLTAFMNLNNGSGRLVLVSNIRPLNLPRLIEDGHVFPICGGNTRDQIQLGGFTLEELIEYSETKLSEGDLDQYLLLDAFYRLSGHPKALGFFTSLSDNDQIEFMSNSSDDQPLSTYLKQLLSLSIEYCTNQEMKLLTLLSLLRRPESERFLSNVEFNLKKENIDKDLEDLNRRSLIEFGVEERIGYSSHAIVSEHIHNIVNNTALQNGYLALATHYESKAQKTLNLLPADLTKESFQTVVETAYHYFQAKSFNKATFWRNQATKFSIQTGKESYFAGNFAASMESAEDYIKANSELIQTPASPRYLSNAYFYKALNQYYLSFDWHKQIHDLKNAIRINPKNEKAISFLVPVSNQAIKRRIPWGQIQCQLMEISQLIQLEEDIYPSSGCIRILCLIGSHTDNSTIKNEIYKKLERISKQITNPMPFSILSLSENEFIAYIELFNFLRIHTAFENSAREFSKHLEAFTKVAVVSHNNSVRLRIKRVESLIARANYATNNRIRLQYLIQAKSNLLEINNYATIPTGFARQLSTITNDITFNLDNNTALAEIHESFSVLDKLSANSSIHSIPNEELDAAAIRLYLRKAQLDLENEKENIKKAISIFKEYLLTPDKWLPLEIADLIIKVLTSSKTEFYSSEKQSQEPNNDAELDSTFVINKNLITKFEKKISNAQCITPNKRFSLLQFSLRVEFLKKNWTKNDPNEPKIISKITALADSILLEGPKTTETLTILVEYYRIIATSVFSEQRFHWAKEKFLEVINSYLEDENFIRTVYFQKARFLRAVLDYQASRKAMHKYFDNELYPFRRLRANHLFLDSVSHSIHKDTIINPNLDPELFKDAMTTLKLFNTYLKYLNKKHENIEDINCAVRELQSIKCAAYTEKYKIGDLAWVKEIYNSLHIDHDIDGGRTFKNINILSSLVDKEDRIAQILGNHCLEGTLWREVGTLLSSLLLNESTRIDTLTHFWEISNTLLEKPLTNIYRSRSAYNLAQLNLVRIQLNYPMNSKPWKEGCNRLKELTQKQRMPWVYWQFIIEVKQKNNL